MKKDYAMQFFNNIETIRTSSYSHYLIKNKSLLEIQATKIIYFEIKAINDMLDMQSWGVLYPIYRFYLNCRGAYWRWRFKKKLWHS